jgi:hypothetical protein
VSPPGRYAQIEPYVVFAGTVGLEPGVPLVRYVPGDWIGGTGGAIDIVDVNADNVPEIVYNATVGAHGGVLWVVGWDGSTLAPLFAMGSDTPAVTLEDLDGDGIQEIVLPTSGYCGGYAASPRLMSVFRWEGGAYRSASARFPSLQDVTIEHAAEALDAFSRGRSSDADTACVQHMLALAYALQGKPAELRTAFRAYLAERQKSPADRWPLTRPTFTPSPHVEADLRAVVAATTSGTSAVWGPMERAALHDLLGDVLTSRAESFEYRAKDADEHGRPDRAQEWRNKAGQARAAAEREYLTALGLDPTDEEAKRALGR